ncbi:hypothetical protein DPM19_13915 [Actinomadura craniellae]|uniref:NACHT domain-containing protein n=1 Tax=Actinomadura craniellae TaxID=2231787 RepID=A0A365H724_9ACTN|nr:NACHT domain-containing protein [Actinomadura craniellae]RAY14818.1 hypothetical protein DPM19_13915 [Actinomadura craniellae]
MAGRRKARGARWRTAVLVAGLVALVGLPAWVAATGLRGDPAAAGTAAGVAATVLAVPVLAVGLWTWWRRTAGPRPVPVGEEVARVRETLAVLVARQWDGEALIRSLDDPAPIPVRWRVTGRPELLDHPANLTPGVLVSASGGDIAGLVAEFRRLERRRLVVLGGPGTGKTTLAVQLVRELLATRAEESEPVPVLVSAAGWDTGRFPRLRDWLADHLALEYPELRAPGLGPDMPEVLVERGHVLPVLDGLDELPEPAQAAMITALNGSLGTGQLVLTSRTGEFARALEAAGDALTSALVVEPDPLTPETAAAYLERCLPPRPAPAWERVLAALRTPDGQAATLAGLVTTPLNLWLLRTVYITRRADPAPLLDGTRFPGLPALRAHLLGQLIPALIAARAGEEDFARAFPHCREPAEVRRGLGYLARHLTDQGTRDFAWWRLARTVHGRWGLRFRGGLAAGRGTALAVGLGAALMVVPNGVGAALLAGAVAGAVAGLPAAVVVGFMMPGWAWEPPGFADLRLRERLIPLLRVLREEVGILLVVGLVIGFAVGHWSAAGAGAGVVLGLWAGGGAGLVIRLISGFVSWSEAPVTAERISTPLASWRADRTLNLLRAGSGLLGSVLVIAVTIGVMAAAVGAWGRGSDPLLLAGLVMGFMSGLPVGLRGAWSSGFGRGRHHAWWAYQLVTRRLARQGLLPRRLMPFLDEAHRLGLLRAVGPVYQFRHADLQDYLAETYLPGRERSSG